MERMLLGLGFVQCRLDETLVRVELEQPISSRLSYSSRLRQKITRLRSRLLPRGGERQIKRAGGYKGGRMKIVGKIRRANLFRFPLTCHIPNSRSHRRKMDLCSTVRGDLQGIFKPIASYPWRRMTLTTFDGWRGVCDARRCEFVLPNTPDPTFQFLSFNACMPSLHLLHVGARRG